MSVSTCSYSDKGGADEPSKKDKSPPKGVSSVSVEIFTKVTLHSFFMNHCLYCCLSMNRDSCRVIDRFVRNSL